MPQFEDAKIYFERIGLNIDLQRNGWLLTPDEHRKLSAKWTAEWKDFISAEEEKALTTDAQKLAAQKRANEKLSELFNQEEYLEIYNTGGKAPMSHQQWSAAKTNKSAVFNASQKALKLITVLLAYSHAIDTGKNAFAGVLELGDPRALTEYETAMAGLMKHAADPNSTGLSEADEALFGMRENRMDMSYITTSDPAGLVTRMLAAHAKANAMSRNGMMNLYDEAQRYFSRLAFEHAERSRP